jgi:hypothetical protein
VSAALWSRCRPSRVAASWWSDGFQVAGDEAHTKTHRAGPQSVGHLVRGLVREHECGKIGRRHEKCPRSGCDTGCATGNDRVHLVDSGSSAQGRQYLAYRPDAVSGTSQRVHDARFAHGGRRIAPTLLPGDPLRQDKPLGVPVPQRGRAHTEGPGQLRDPHDVVGPAVHRLGSHPGERVAGQVQQSALAIEAGMHGIEESQCLVGRPRLQIANEPAGFHRPDDPRQPAIGAGCSNVPHVVPPVARCGPRHGRQHSVPFEDADLLDGVPDFSRDIDGAQHIAVETRHRRIQASRPITLYGHFNVTLEGMTIDDILAFARTLDGTLAVTPSEGDGSPEIAWGDTFLYYAPDGRPPQHTQPYATVVTKDYPDDERSGLDRPGAFRVNIAVSKTIFRELIGCEPRETTVGYDYAAPDTIVPHPVYGLLGWVAIVNPGPATHVTVRQLLAGAHDAAKRRFDRRTGR